jgi:hypothetical protein
MFLLMLMSGKLAIVANSFSRDIWAWWGESQPASYRWRDLVFW